MENKKRRSGLSGLFASLIFAAEVFFIGDMALARSSSNMPPVIGIITFAAAFFVIFVLSRANPRAAGYAALTLSALIVLTVIVCGMLWYGIYEHGVYADDDTGKGGLYRGRRVMVLVPHEDDEINLMGGVLEQYVKYGSTVYIVYLTNGDMAVPAERRLAEAIDGMSRFGIPESNLIFLGYGDSLFEDGTEIYFLDDDRVVTSHAGRTQTYGTASHPAYREGRDYTLANMYEDVRDVINEYRPDVIFCSDYDEHADHRLLSLLFDRAMGELLRSYRNYRPDIFKGFTYSTAYYAPQNFYSVNLPSTVNPGTADYMQESNVYLWNDRVRFPVCAGSLSRSMFSSRIYQALSCYTSTETRKMADGIIKGDKVFWQRDTSSLCYYTDVDATSGDPSAVNDFMLVDRKDPDISFEPSQNVWIPDKNDPEKTVTMHFTEPIAVSRIKLYDNPSLEDNILDAIITLDRGTEIHTGPLPKNGSAGEFEFGERTLTSISVTIVESEGDRAGLSEIEAFNKPFSRDYRFLKLMTGSGDFIYDYYINDSGHEYFRLYIRGASAEQLDLRVSCYGGSACRAKLENGRLEVVCPDGDECVVTVASADGTAIDSVRIRNGNTDAISAGQVIEKYVRKELREGIIRSNTWIILRTAKDFIRGLAA